MTLQEQNPRYSELPLEELRKLAPNSLNTVENIQVQKRISELETEAAIKRQEDTERRQRGTYRLARVSTIIGVSALMIAIAAWLFPLESGNLLSLFLK